VELTVVDAAGKVIGKSQVGLNSLTRVDNEGLVVMLCGDRKLCDAIQSQISFSGSTEEVSEKNRRFKFLALDRPRERWWDYDVAGFLVVADPVSRWIPEERLAVERHLRGGGRVVLMEKESADPSFLAAYRHRVAKDGPVQVGRGSLWTIADIENQTLGLMFTGKLLKSMVDGASPFPALGGSFGEWLRNRVGVTFRFPRLRWILLSMTVYILVVGLANFALLHRLRKMEWGWISTTSIAILFAISFYMLSSAKRPKQLTVDDIPIYWMDSHSPIAQESLGLRVSSPRQQSVSLKIADDELITTRAAFQPNIPNAQIATAITESRREVSGWQVSLGPPLEVELRSSAGLS
jgi:hypothetical protein